MDQYLLNKYCCCAFRSVLLSTMKITQREMNMHSMTYYDCHGGHGRKNDVRFNSNDTDQIDSSDTDIYYRPTADFKKHFSRLCLLFIVPILPLSPLIQNLLSVIKCNVVALPPRVLIHQRVQSSQCLVLYLLASTIIVAINSKLHLQER